MDLAQMETRRVWQFSILSALYVHGIISRLAHKGYNRLFGFGCWCVALICNEKYSGGK
jgi:hypothetical protein